MIDEQRIHFTNHLANAIVFRKGRKMGMNTHDDPRDCRPRLRYVHFPFDLIVWHDGEILQSFSRLNVVQYETTNIKVTITETAEEIIVESSPMFFNK